MTVKMAAREKEEEAPKQQPVKKRSRIAGLLLIALAAVLAGGILMGAFAYFVGIPGVAPRMRAAPPPEYETYELPERVINLGDTGGIRYVRVRIVLEFSKNEKMTQELEHKNAQVMEEILRIFRSKTVEDIRPIDTEGKLKTEIINALNSKLESGKIERVYFTDFLIQ
jgi:flagellar FliL protein